MRTLTILAMLMLTTAGLARPASAQARFPTETIHRVEIQAQPGAPWAKWGDFRSRQNAQEAVARIMFGGWAHDARIRTIKRVKKIGIKKRVPDSIRKRLRTRKPKPSPKSGRLAPRRS